MTDLRTGVIYGVIYVRVIRNISGGLLLYLLLLLLLLLLLSNQYIIAIINNALLR